MKKVKPQKSLSPDEENSLLYELRVHQAELEAQNEELRHLQVDLANQRDRYQKLYDQSPTGYVSLSKQGLILDANRTMATLLDVDQHALLLQPLTCFIFSEDTDQDIYSLCCKRLLETGKSQVVTLRMLRAGTNPFWVRLEIKIAEDFGGRVTHLVVITDITEQKQTEEHESLTREVLACMNRSENTPDTIANILLLIKKSMDVEAVGIRLREDDDCPYFATDGFAEQFMRMERSLCATDASGHLLRDAQGDPVLEGMCGNIICGRTDPKLPFFTEGGSFWSNCTTDLLASTTEKDRQARTRNRCNREGYESLALIPLRAGEEVIGLLQLNDHRQNRFTLATIHFLEGLSSAIGIPFSRLQANESLRKSEELYRSLFENMLNCFIYCRILFANGTPQDFIILSANAAFAQQTGLKDAAGRKASELVPGIHELDPQILEISTRVALSGQPECFEIFISSMQLWCNVSVHSPKREHFVAVFDAVNERKQAEQILAAQARLAEAFMTSSEDCVIDNVLAIIKDAMSSPLVLYGYIDPAENLVLPAMAKPLWRKLQTPGEKTLLPRAIWGKCRWSLALRDKIPFFDNEKILDTPKGHPVIERYLCVPVLHHAEVIGLFIVANKKTNYLSKDLATLEAIVNFLGPVLHSRLLRQQTLEALQKSEESYRLQFHQNSSAMLLIDQKNGSIIDANLAAQAFYGYSHEQFLCKGIHELSNKDDHVLIGLIMASITEAHGQHFEFAHCLADGAVCNVEVSISLIQLREHPVLHLIVQDITQRKETESVLKKQLGTYEDILATTLDGFCIADFQGNILDVNECSVNQSGYSRQELLTMQPQDLDVYDATAAQVAERNKKVLESGYIRFETKHRRKDGSIWDVEVSLGTNNKAGGQFVAFLRDITERKTNEEQIARALREKEVLLKEVHHRVKNNMQVIHSLLSLQARRIADPTVQDMFDASLSRINSMALIHERLYQSKDLVNIDFKEYLKSLVNTITSNYHCPNVSCVVEMPPIFLDVNAGIPCGLIVNELISNSLKHAFPEGREGAITVGIHKNSHGDNVITVADNGIGLQPESAPNNTVSLGLQIVNGLTQQLHGKLECSTVNGSRFSITFPATPPPQCR